MADATIPVDLFNPGQVFACLGFVEAADVLLGSAEGAFDWSDRARTCFRIKTAGNENPIAAALEFVTSAKIHSEAPPRSKNVTSGWEIPTVLLGDDDAFPFPDPPSPQTLPAVLSKEGGVRLVLDHWGEADATTRDDVKFWAGAAGYPGVAYLRDAIDLIKDRSEGAVADPFAVSAPQKSSFRFDWRRDYIPIEIGFSLNPHGARMETVGYPIVEIFAALGLGNARPRRADRFDKLEYFYGVVGGGESPAFLDPTILRAALGAPPKRTFPFPQRTFRMKLGWPGQEGQARAITTVTEETT